MLSVISSRRLAEALAGRRRIVSLAAAVVVIAAGVGITQAAPASAVQSPAQVCGPGFHPASTPVVSLERNSDKIATVYMFWDPIKKRNCGVLVKAKGLAGKSSYMMLRLQSPGHPAAEDSGRFSYYAGPVIVTAPGCLKVDVRVNNTANRTEVTWGNGGKGENTYWGC